MKIIHDVDPDFLAKLDKKNNIIMSVAPTEETSLIESEYFPDTFSIALARDLNLSANDVLKISSSTLAATIRPKIKICYPVGLKIQFSDFINDPNQDIYWKIYKSFDIHNVYNDEASTDIDHHLVSNIVMVMYLDTIRMREANVQMLVKKNTSILDFYFAWYVQTKKDMPQIEQIYLISDQHVYEDFNNIF